MPKGGIVSRKRIQQIEQRIDRIKRMLLEIGPMRPVWQYRLREYHG